jgi:hypothetical protein
MFSWLSCKKFCQCASERFDRKLKWYQVPRYVFHYCICFACRRYVSQLETIEKACGTSGEDLNEAALHSSQCLSADARKRVAERILAEVDPGKKH